MHSSALLRLVERDLVNIIVCKEVGFFEKPLKKTAYISYVIIMQDMYTKNGLDCYTLATVLGQKNYHRADQQPKVPKYGFG